MKRLSLLIIAFLMACCNRKEVDITGAWFRFVPGGSRWGQGIQLNPDSTAFSIGINNLILESWEREGDLLILKGKRVINRIAFAFTDTLVIDKRTNQDSLFLRQGDNVQAFGRGKTSSE